MLRKIPQDLLKRYAFDGDIARLYRRVVAHVKPDASILDKMLDNKFLPAGNTLVAGAYPLAPNCSVIGTISDANQEEKRRLFIKLLSQATGVGLDLSATSDPVAVLRSFAQDAASISLAWQRPLRGNMAVLRIDHPRVMEFIRCKSDPMSASALAMFNISVAVTDAFMESRALYASPLFDALCEAAHTSGDPGVVFIDRAQFGSPLAVPGERIVAPVSCGEQFMYEGETCTLGAINLDRFVRCRGDSVTFDMTEYSETIHHAIDFLDTVIDKLSIPDPLMQQRALALRRVGLGVMGLANTLTLLGIPYESSDALAFSDALAQCLTREAVQESERLALLRGPHAHSTTRRNITTTCLAPTGGIRRLVDDDGYAIEPFFREATTISPTFSVRMAATWQRHIENAVSKTVNLPHDATIDDVRTVYHLAYEYGCKGITVYRDGCRDHQPITLKCRDGECTF